MQELQIAPARNTLLISCVCAPGDPFDDDTRVELHYDELTFFTHQVNGQTYGAWYRQLAPDEIEVLGAGFLSRTSYAGRDELSVARSVLEEFVRVQMQAGARPPSLDSGLSA
jgi:hypothetical protein